MRALNQWAAVVDTVGMDRDSGEMVEHAPVRARA